MADFNGGNGRSGLARRMAWPGTVLVVAALGFGPDIISNVRKDMDQHHTLDVRIVKLEDRFNAHIELLQFQHEQEEEKMREIDKKITLLFDLIRDLQDDIRKSGATRRE